MNWNDECKYRFRGQYSKENNEQILLFDLEEPEVIKHEIIQEGLSDKNTSECLKDTADKSENKTKKIVRTLFPKQWKNHFGCRTEEVVLLHRVKYCGNWDVLRPAKIVEGMEVISENLLKKLDNEAQNNDRENEVCSMSEMMMRQANDNTENVDQKALELAQDFSYDGYQVVRRELFAHLREPAVVIRRDSVTFNTACIAGLEDAVYIQILVNQDNKRMVVRKCEENDKDALRWCIEKPDKRKSRKMSNKFILSYDV